MPRLGPCRRTYKTTLRLSKCNVTGEVCFVEYADVCSKLSVLFDDSDATTLLIASDIHVKELKLTQFKNNPQNGPAKEEQTDTAGHRNAWCSTSYFNEM